jgi:hypothetical protein
MAKALTKAFSKAVFRLGLRTSEIVVFMAIAKAAINTMSFEL